MKTYFLLSLFAAALYAIRAHDFVLLAITFTPVYIQVCRLSWQIVARKVEDWDKI